MHAKRPAQAPTDPVLTPRLVLTPVGPDDVDDLLLLSSDPVVASWTGPWTGAAVEAWAAEMAARWTTDGVGRWMARDRSDGSLVGRGGFTRIDLEGETVLELGWAVRDARTGRGYATEPGRAALAWAVEHQPGRPVVAFTEVHNRASRAVMERLGMRPAGIIRREGLVEGRTGVHPDAPSRCTDAEVRRNSLTASVTVGEYEGRVSRAAREAATSGACPRGGKEPKEPSRTPPGSSPTIRRPHLHERNLASTTVTTRDRWAARWLACSQPNVAALRSWAARVV